MNEVYEFLKAVKTYYLATDDNGQPKVRPFGTVDLFEGAIYIQTGLSKDVAKQMKKNPKVEICAFKAEAGEWIRITAEAIEDPRIEAQDHMLDSYPHLRKRYTPGDGNTAVFKLVNGTATFNSFTAAPRTVDL